MQSYPLHTHNIVLFFISSWKQMFGVRRVVSVVGRLCIGEVRVDLEHLCSCSWKQCKKNHGSFSENNYPLVYIHCIIKIMCQASVLGWLDCLFTMCSTKTETLAVVREFTFFTGESNGSETFCTLLLYKLFKFLKKIEFFGVTEVY